MIIVTVYELDDGQGRQYHVHETKDGEAVADRTCDYQVREVTLDGTPGFFVVKNEDIPDGQ